MIICSFFLSTQLTSFPMEGTTLLKDVLEQSGKEFNRDTENLGKRYVYGLYKEDFV